MIISANFIPSGPTNVCLILQKAGYQAFIVGGCVRDLLLNKTPKDYDITTDAKPEDVMRLFPEHYPTGLQHGTVTVFMGEGIENHFEITTFRIEQDYQDGRRPSEVFFVNNIEQDLARRDFTINAIAYNPINNNLIDPFNGINDLNNKILKAVGDANLRFQEDGLRLMRAIRFASQLNFTIEEKTVQSLSKNLFTLQKVSKERIKDELCKILLSPNPVYGLEILQQSGILILISPLINKKISFTHLHILQGLKPELETILASLYCLSYVKQISQEMKTLKFSNINIQKTTFLCQLWQEYQNLAPAPLPYRRFMAHIKNQCPGTWEAVVQQFIKLSRTLGTPFDEVMRYFPNQTIWAKSEMLINGDDLLKLQIPQGPQIKNILEQCYEEILLHPESNNQEFLINYVKSLIK